MPKTGFMTPGRSYKVTGRQVSSTPSKLGPGKTYGNFSKDGFGVEFWGDWDKFRSWLGIDQPIYITRSGVYKTINYGLFEDRIQVALDTAAKRCVVLLVREIKNGLKSGAPGGKGLKPLSGMTFSLRRKKGKAKTWVGKQGTGYIKGQKPLLRTGDLYRAITGFVLERGSFFVGVPSGATNREGESLTMIAATMERGMVLRVTKKMANYFAFLGTPLKNTTTHLVIPARPFIGPVIKANLSTIYKIYRDELRDAILESYNKYSAAKLKSIKLTRRTKDVSAANIKAQAKIKAAREAAKKPRGRPKLSEKEVAKRQKLKAKEAAKRQKLKEKAAKAKAKKIAKDKELRELKKQKALEKKAKIEQKIKEQKQAIKESKSKLKQNKDDRQAQKMLEQRKMILEKLMAKAKKT